MKEGLILASLMDILLSVYSLDSVLFGTFFSLYLRVNKMLL